MRNSGIVKVMLSLMIFASHILPLSAEENIIPETDPTSESAREIIEEEPVNIEITAAEEAESESPEVSEELQEETAEEQPKEITEENFAEETEETEDEAENSITPEDVIPEDEITEEIPQPKEVAQTPEAVSDAVTEGESEPMPSEEADEESDYSPSIPEGAVYMTGDDVEEDPSEVMAASYNNLFLGSRNFTFHQGEGRKILSYVNNFRTSGKAWIWNEDNKTKTTGIKSDALEYDYALEQIAMQRAAEIAIYFDHTRPSGNSCFTAAYTEDGTTYYASGENILFGYGFDVDAPTAFDMWREENQNFDGQGHRRNMLDSGFTAVGIGYAEVNGYQYWAMELGTKTPAVKTAALEGNEKIWMPVHTHFISSYSHWKADPSSITLGIGETSGLPVVTAKIVVSSDTMSSLSFSNAMPALCGTEIEAGDPAVIEKIDTAKIQGLIPGSASVILTIPTGNSQKKITVPVRVIKKVTGVSLNETEITIDRDTSYQLRAIIEPEDASDQSVTWKSSDKNIVSVSSDGLITAKKGGTAVITAVTDDGGYSASCTVHVEVHVTSVDFEYDQLRLREGMSESLEYTILPEDALDQSVVFTSSDEAILTVDESGKVTALKPGTAEVTIRTNDRERTDTVEITVLQQSKAEAPVLEYFAENGEKTIAGNGEEISVARGTLIFFDSQTPGAEIWWKTEGQEPVRFTEPLVPEESAVYSAYAASTGMTDSDVSVFTVNIMDDSLLSGSGDLREEDIREVNEKYGGIVPDGIWAAGADRYPVYTGNKITFPDLRIYDHKTLLDGSSYSLVYKNNINVSSDTFDSYLTWIPEKKTTVSYIQITGKGNYSGKVYIPFEIQRKQLDDETLAENLWLKETGKAQKPVPAVTDRGRKLKINKDYKLAYVDGSGKEYASSEGVSAAGVYTVVITGINNYAGEKTCMLTIGNDPLTVPMSRAKISAGTWNAEDGMPVTADTPLAVAVKSGNHILAGDTYRIVRVENGDRPGKASVTLEGTGLPDPDTGIKLAGTKTVTVPIKGISLSKAAAEIPAYTFNGSEIRPDGFEVRLGDRVLSEGTDYVITGYSSNIKAGKKASVKIAGTGMYSGTKTFRFVISPCDLSNVSYIIPGIAEYSPAGAALDIYAEIDGYVLQKGRDYTVKYSGNKAAGARAQCVITGKGSFTGTQTYEYRVLRKELSDLSLTVSDIAHASAKKGTYYRAKFTLKDGSKSLGVKDYDTSGVSYSYVYDSRVKQYGTNRKVLRMAGDEIGINDIPEAGTLLRVAVPAKDEGNYSGEISAVYKVIPAAYSLSKAAVKFRAVNEEGTETIQKSLTKTYTGKAIVLEEKELYLTMKIDGTEYVLNPEDFEIVSYTSNIAKGTAKAVLKGTGDFGGTKTVSFKIAAKKTELKNILFGAFTDILNR